MDELTAKEARSRYNNKQLDNVLKNIRNRCSDFDYYEVWDLSQETISRLKKLGYKISW